MLVDIHSHHSVPYPEGVVNIMDGRLPRVEGQLFSAGIHPWDTAEEVPSYVFEGLEELASRPEVVAIGECGIDTMKGGPMFRQLQVFRKQIELSEQLEKPLVIHAVKASDIILGLKRDFAPKQPWIIHGFRGKPAQARQLLDKGLYLSFGECFNSDTVRMMPLDCLLAETDESPKSIEEIIGALSALRGEDLTPSIASLTASLLKLPSSH